MEYATQGDDKRASYSTRLDFFGTAPGSTLYSVSIAPAWQQGDLFARVDMGLRQAHVTAGGAKPLEAQGALEAGMLF